MLRSSAPTVKPGRARHSAASLAGGGCSASASMRAWWGERSQAGSVAAASPRTASAWQRQPPKSISRRSQDRQGSRHPVGAAEGLERRRVRPDVRQRRGRAPTRIPGPGMVSAAWHGSTRPDGVTFSDRRAQPPMQASAAARSSRARRGRSPCGRRRRGRIRSIVAIAVQHLRRASASARRGCAAPSRSTGCAPPPRGPRPTHSRQLHQGGHAVDIGAVDHRVDGERQTQLPRPCARRPACAHVRAGIAGDAVGRVRVARPGSRPAHDPARLAFSRASRASIEADRRGDQVGVQPGLVRRRGDLDQVAAARRARRRTGAPAARPVAAASLEHARPGRWRPARRLVFQRQRVGAIRDRPADSDASVRPAGRAAREPGGTGSMVSPPAAASPRVRPASRSRRPAMTARSAVNSAASSSTIWPTVRVPSQRCRISLAGPSASMTRSGESSTQAPRVLSKCSRTPGARRGRSGKGAGSGIARRRHEGAGRDQPRRDIGDSAVHRACTTARRT